MRRIDVTGLGDEDLKLVKKLVDFLRVKREKQIKEKQEDIQYREWRLGVKRPVTREDIYDYL